MQARSPHILPVCCLLALLALPGCARPDRSQTLLIQPAQYTAAFDAAADSARRAGMTPVVRDRRGGIIESTAAHAGSLIEPWRQDNASLGDAVEHTLANQRRRARFEFLPATESPQSDSPAGGTDIFATRSQVADLTGSTGPIELRVWVYVERAHAPYLKRDTWSMSLATTYASIDPRSGKSALPNQFWTAVHRDRAYEQRLLAEVADAIDNTMQ